VRKNLLQIPKWSAAGVDGQTVEAAKESFNGWIEPMLQQFPKPARRPPGMFWAPLIPNQKQPSVLSVDRSPLDLKKLPKPQSLPMR
jgi:hypothetical protein